MTSTTNGQVMSGHNNGNSAHHNHHNHMLQVVNGGPVISLHSLSGSPVNSSVNLSNYSLSNTVTQFDDNTLEYDSQDRLENWLSIPNKRNIKKHGWKKLYVVLRKGKLFFYNSLRDNKESQEPYMTIDLEYKPFFYFFFPSIRLVWVWIWLLGLIEFKRFDFVKR